MLSNRAWRTVALIALLAAGAWVVLSCWALLDAGLHFEAAAVPVAVLAAPVLAACGFALAARIRRPLPRAVRDASVPRAPPAALPW